jgi:hypothetical protein
MKNTNNRVAILIVNGGKDPEQGKWIQLCINKILEHAEWSNYQMYVWNNNVEDLAVVDFLKSIPLVTLVQANPSEKLAHVHVVPIQRLYELVCNDSEKPKYIVTIDSDAHPIQKGWLQQLISSLNDEVVLAGVWRDELKKAIKPYVHPSCLCTTVDFIEKYNIRLDFIAPNTATEIHDALSILTEIAEKNGLKIHKLYRSNKNNFHRLIGGIYGDLIYHHGGGSRGTFGFWDEQKTKELKKKNKEMGRISANLLFDCYDNYINWLQGNIQERDFEIKMTQLEAREITEEKDQKNNILNSYLQKDKNIVLSFLLQVKKIMIKLPKGDGFKALFVKPTAQNSKKQGQVLKKFPSQMLRPFILSDLKSIPEGWRSNGPDFVGIGAPKAGTSWWFSLLLEHPQIVGHRLFDEKKDIMRTKEIQYFPHFGYKGIDETQLETYRQAFAAPEGSICGEFSVQYFCYPFCLKYLADAAPDSKILLILRNPIDRMISHFNHLLSNRPNRYSFDAEQLYVYKTFSVYPEATLHSLYAYALKQLLRYFDRSKILILQYEKCKENPYREIARTYQFLGVDDRYQPQNVKGEVNRKQYVVQSLTPEERQHLAAYFVDDVRTTVEMFPEIDISLWSDFADLNRSLS